MRHTSLRVRALITDPIIPRVGDGPQLCHWCQRKTMLAGGFELLLTDELDNTARRGRKITWRQHTAGEWANETHAWLAFRRLRWPTTNGEPVCPKCGDHRAYFIEGRRIWKCKNNTCYYQYTVTSGTPFNSRKMDIICLMTALSNLHLSAAKLGEMININPIAARMLKFKAKAFFQNEGFPKASFAGGAVKGSSPVRQRPVRAIHPDGTTKDYPKITAVREDGYRPTNVSQCLSGSKKTHFGVKWSYI